MQLRDLERLAGEVYAGDLCTASSHRLGQHAGTAADVEDTLACQHDQPVDPRQS
jgi:hypothetical protein